MARTASATYDTLPPNNTSRTPSLPIAAIDGARSGLSQRRGAQRCGGAGVTPRVIRFVDALPFAFGVQRTGVGGVALQRVAARVRPAEGLRQHRVGRLVRRRVLALVAVAAPAPRTIRRRRRAGRTPDSTPGRRAAATRGAARGARRAGLVLIGHPFITLCWSARNGRRRSARLDPPYRRLRRSRCVPSANCGWSARLGRLGGAWSGIWDNIPAASWVRDRARVPQCRSGLPLGVDLGRALGHNDRWCAARRCAVIRSSPSTKAATASVDRCSVEPNCRGPTGASLCEAN